MNAYGKITYDSEQGYVVGEGVRFERIRRITG